jgi:hypothetical protein
MAGAGLFWEKSTAGWLLVAGLLWEKSTADWWLIIQANGAYVVRPLPPSRQLSEARWPCRHHCIPTRRDLDATHGPSPSMPPHPWPHLSAATAPLPYLSMLLTPHAAIASTTRCHRLQHTPLSHPTRAWGLLRPNAITSYGLTLRSPPIWHCSLPKFDFSSIQFNPILLGFDLIQIFAA